MELIVVGGGVAGCAAALTAAGVGMRVLVVEREGALCAKVARIPALHNVLGFRTGARFAAAVAADLAACDVRTGTGVTAVEPGDDAVTVTLDDGSRHTAPHVVLATGVGPRQPADADWIDAPAGLRLPPLSDADPADAEGRTWLVVGADRPLGTFLRAYPGLDVRLLVPHPPADAYKTEEVADDPRVTLLPTRHLTLPGGLRYHAAYANIGSVPAAPAGAVRDADGYCPPDRQHPRVLVAGDLRSARYQRIMTAIGSGTEAALRAYYTARGVPGAGASPSSVARRAT